MIYYAREYSFKEGKHIYKYNVIQNKKTEEKNKGKEERERAFKEEKKM